MADRTIAPVGDAFLVLTAVISSLTTQILLALLGLGAGIVTLGAASPDTIAWGGFLWWAASGVFAGGVGGMTIAALGDGIDDSRKTVLALIAWATAILIVAFVMALAAGGAASVFSAVAGAVPGMLEPAADGKLSEAAQRALAAAAISSVVALVLGAAAQVAGAIYAPETKVKVAKRAQDGLKEGGASQPMSEVFQAGVNAWRIERASRAAVLVDGAAYFGAVREALRHAQR